MQQSAQAWNSAERAPNEEDAVKGGYKVIDTDTHVGPTNEVFLQYASPALKERWDELTPYGREVRDGTMLSINPYPYKRQMRESLAEGSAERGGVPSLMGSIRPLMRETPQPQVQNLNVEGRLADMDREGRDVDVIIPGTFSTAISGMQTDLALELYAAYHRYIGEYCSANPDRLKATILAPGADPEWAAAELKKLASEKWVCSATVILPEGLPIDDPSLDPIWRVMDDNDLPILHHSFFYEPPYFPGYRDVWGHIAIARSAAHIWGAQRLLGYALMSGLFDEYPNLRIGFAECSTGWLGAWLIRLEGQAYYLRKSLPVIKHTAREYAQQGRVFCGIEPYEGEETARSLMEIVGDGTMMFQSDYPHDQCHFPDTPDEVINWNLPEETKRKIMSENAERYLRIL
jgi:predicted TIM-barrel fold metal-dependent hydrolase